MRRFVAPVLAALMSACATMHGPQTTTLSTSEIEQRIQADLGSALELFKGLGTGRPEVSLMPVSERLQLEWNFDFRESPTSLATGLAVEISGKPALNAARNGIDLTQVRIEDVRVKGLPRFLGLSRLADQKGMTLPDLPLMTLPAELLRRGDVAYEATGVHVGYFGLGVDITPR